MGREIRRVPADWKHPRDDNGLLKPLFNESYEEAAQKWLKDLMAWEDGTHKDCEGYKQEYRYYWDWDGNPPNKEHSRPAFQSEPTHYQIYETVSEGTPVSPVFATKEEMVEWLVKNGYSRDAAKGFAEEEWAPSLMMDSSGIHKNIESCAFKGEIT